MKNHIVVHVPAHEYYGGDVINGLVELVVVKSVKSRGVQLVFRGFEHVDFHHENATHDKVRVRDNNTFLLYKMRLSGDQSNTKKEEKFKPGTYRWPFSLLLPNKLPATVKEKYGSILYEVFAFVDVVMGFDLKARHRIQVGGDLLDRNHFLTYNAQTGINQKSFLFATGATSIQAMVQKNHLFIGEEMRINVVVDNHSTKKANGVYAVLEQKVVFTPRNGNTHSGHTSKKKLDTKRVKISILPEGKLNQDLVMTIPSVSPSVLANTHLGGKVALSMVSVSYTLKVYVDIPWSKDLRATIPIMIMKNDPKFANVQYIPAPAGGVVVVNQSFYGQQPQPQPPTQSFYGQQPKQPQQQPPPTQSFYGQQPQQPPNQSFYGQQPQQQPPNQSFYGAQQQPQQQHQPPNQSFYGVQQTSQTQLQQPQQPGTVYGNYPQQPLPQQQQPPAYPGAPTTQTGSFYGQQQHNPQPQQPQTMYPGYYPPDQQGPSAPPVDDGDKKYPLPPTIQRQPSAPINGYNQPQHQPQHQQPLQHTQSLPNGASQPTSHSLAPSAPPSTPSLYPQPSPPPQHQHQPQPQQQVQPQYSAPRSNLYPQLEGYTFPTNLSAVTLQFGNSVELSDEDRKLIDED